MRRALLLVTSTREAVMLMPAYLWAVLGAIMLATCVLVGGWSESAKAAQSPAQLSITDLGTLPDGSDSVATAINNRGQVVGRSTMASGAEHAFLWEKGEMMELGTLGGDSSSASGINDRGQIVGTSTTASGAEHAFLWEDGKMTDLGTLADGGFNDSAARAINNRGQVVGESSTDSGVVRAFLWEDGKMIDLGTLPGGDETSAYGINNRGQVVGVSVLSGDARAVLWTK